MQDKRTQIVETALRLFGEKGYHLTSMQDIADAVGIAKGSTYLHFKSKEDLLIGVYRYVYESWVEEMMAIADRYSDQPKRVLHESISRQFEIMKIHGKFILMQMNENAIPNNDEIRALFIRMHMESMQWTRERIIDAYGEEARSYAYDGAAVFQSVVKTYVAPFIIGQLPIDGASVAELVLGTLDLVMEGFHLRKLTPVLTPSLVEKMICTSREGLPLDGGDPRQHALRYLQQLRRTMKALKLEPVRQEELEHSLLALEEEWHKDEPRMPVIRGMIRYLASLEQPELMDVIRTLEGLTALKSQGSAS